MESLAAWVAETIAILGYGGVLFLMMLESIILPLPSEIILPFAGFLVSQGALDLWLVTIAATVGSVLGSMISYEVGRAGGRPFLVKYGRFFWIAPQRLHTADRWFRRHGELTIVVSRILPLTRYFISIPAGIARMDRHRFVLFTAIGSFVWNLALIYGGVLLGQHWLTVIEYGAQLEMAFGTIVILLALWYGYLAVGRRARFLRRLAQHENVRLARKHLRRAQRFGRENVEKLAAMARSLPGASLEPPGPRRPLSRKRK